MNFIKRIFDGKTDERIHLQFQKFSKGEFRNRAIIEVKSSSKDFTIKTSAEFANELIFLAAKKLGDSSTKISGCIVSTQDISGEFEFKDKKQFQGVKRYMIEKEMTGKEIINLLEKFPRAFFAFSFSGENFQLKIKAKAPKSGKPGKGDEEPKADFCVFKTSDKEIVKSFVFEQDGFKNAKIKHSFFIEKIEIPTELKNSKDFAKVREESRRIGKIERIANIDDKEIRTEKEFSA